jgi:hypothetical protein
MSSPSRSSKGGLHLDDPGPSRTRDDDIIIRSYFEYADVEMANADDIPDSPHPDSPADHAPHLDEEVLFEEWVNPSQESQPRLSNTSDIDGLDLDRKKQRILLKMMPRVMAEKLARQRSPARKKGEGQSALPLSDTEDDSPLPPGKTRLRKAANAKDIRDIRGDSESEDEQRPEHESSTTSLTLSSSDESDSDSDSVEILHTYRPPPPQPKIEEPEVLDSEGDEDIQFFVQNAMPIRKPVHKANLRDQNLINYMLPRVGGGSVWRKKKPLQGGPRRDQHSTKYKFDIITRDGRAHGRERQMLLPFKSHHQEQGGSNLGGELTKSTRQPIARTASRSTNDALFGGRQHNIDTGAKKDQVHIVEERKPLGRKERERLRKTRAKKNGVYNFTSRENNRITTGRRADAAFFTINLEDEGFHHALAPTWDSGPRYEPPPRKQKQLHVRSKASLFEQPGEEKDVTSVPAGPQKGHIREVTCDLNVKRLPSGKSFALSTYIRKGWLHELINDISGAQGNILLPTTVLCRFEISPTMGVESLCLVVPRLFDALFECATDILDADSDTLSDEWKPGFRVASQIISWYLQNAEESKKALLCETIDREVQRVTNLIDKHSVSFVEKPLLSFCWFLVELSVRRSPRLPATYTELSTSLKVASKVLIQLLLRLGIQKMAAILLTDENLDESSIVHYATELWVRIIHVLLGSSRDGPPKSKLHPFWMAFMDAVHTVPELDSSGSFKTSEDVWLTIFTLCAISQFSVHGMSTAEPRLPAFWDVVAFGLKKVCLTESDEHHRLQSPVLKKRDHYVALVIARCAYLHDTWRWRLDEGSAMFNQLSEIFRSRNFSNLRHEGDYLPKFFTHTDWNLLSVNDSKDTAFSAFLKLIFQAARDEREGKKLVKLKKLLSLAVPLRSLSFTTSHPPHGRGLSMFYNRLSAIALALFLDPNDHDDRINKARSYVTFADVDSKTRHAILCGLQRLAVLMVKHDISLTPMLNWIEELAKILDNELKNFLSSHSGVSNEELQAAPPVQLVKHFFLSVGDIVKSYIHISRFPDPHLLGMYFQKCWCFANLRITGKLKSILGAAAMKSSIVKDEFALLLDTIFTARIKALPNAPRPFTPEEDSQESQNYFGGFDDIDFAAINDTPGDVQVSDVLEKDRIFCQVRFEGCSILQHAHLTRTSIRD